MRQKSTKRVLRKRHSQGLRFEQFEPRRLLAAVVYDVESGVLAFDAELGEVDQVQVSTINDSVVQIQVGNGDSFDLQGDIATDSRFTLQSSDMGTNDQLLIDTSSVTVEQIQFNLEDLDDSLEVLSITGIGSVVVDAGNGDDFVDTSLVGSDDVNPNSFVLPGTVFQRPTAALNTLPLPAGVVPGFDGQFVPANDDGSSNEIDLGFEVSFFGTDYDSLFVNNNGNITFDAPLATFTPFDLTATGQVIIAPFFADVDTSNSDVVTFDQGTYEGRNAFYANYVDVGFFASNNSLLNSFQVIVVDRSDVSAGDFDFIFAYDQIQFETGDASNGVNGVGGNSARVGFSNGSGDPDTFLELPGSAVNGAFLDGGPNSLVAGGSLLFEVRNGGVTVAPTSPQPLYPTDAAFVLLGGRGDDTLLGSDGADLIAGGFGVDVLSGGGNGDLIRGAAGNDTISGGEGDDFLNGGLDDDTLNGDGGNDSLLGASGVDIVSGGSGNDFLNGGAGSDTLNGNDGADSLIGSNGDDIANGGLGDDFINGGIGNDTLNGNDGADSLIGGTGDDITNGGIGDDFLNGGDGNDTINGDDGEDSLIGGTGDDIANGGSGDDFLNGGDGEDTINGNDGNDTLLVGGDGSNTVAGGAGIDTVSFQNATSSVAARISADGSGSASRENDIDVLTGAENLTGSNNDDVLTSLVPIPITIRGLAGDDLIIGGAGDDTLIGNGGDDTIRGLGGNDMIFGEFGSDILNGGAGNDTLIGGGGDDFLLGLGGTDTINGGGGIDTNSFQGLGSGVTATIFNGVSGIAEYGTVVENFVGIESLNGTDFDDVLSAVGNASFALRGLDGDDLILGSNGRDALFGNGGNDILRGFGGGDVIEGGDGNDSLNGGTGDDELFGDDGDDVLIGGAGSDFIDGGDGVDINSFSGIGTGVTADLFASGVGVASYGSVTETFVGIESLFGSANNDVLSAFGRGATLYGSDGDDILTGSTSNDFIVGGAGNDQIFGLAGADQLFGSEGDDDLFGGIGTDGLFGGGGIDRLFGEFGDDTLNGGPGDDLLDGGLGQDTEIQ